MERKSNTPNLSTELRERARIGWQLLLLGFIVLAPIVAPIFGTTSAHFHRWQMFRSTGTGILEVEFRSGRSEESPSYGFPPLSPGLISWSARSVPGRAIARTQVYRNLERVYEHGDQICAQLLAQGQRPATVYVHARQATRKGWVTLADAAFDVCRVPPGGACGRCDSLGGCPSYLVESEMESQRGDLGPGVSRE